ncbi:hypothetical protein BST87_23185 [Salmonella enterica subsp. enterica serovar Typhi]|nr:hypothetical protein BST88_23285 [Salmonella enterica subsp. enterica serovar Typhi]OKK26254.1 hypothetical protein BST87_23185 [Salmonella enterica subsp. enterica serovar Typhi]OKK54642.1 hypothetical protein BST90_12580 [Salmonella enterica subsp. enterica serovar Typhi]
MRRPLWRRFYTFHPISCLFVGCAQKPRSHRYLCSRGFLPLPPRCILNDFVYILHFIFCLNR